MPQLLKLSFVRESVVYELELSWDEKAYVEREIAFDIRASRLEIGAELQQVTVSVAINSDRELVIRGDLFDQISIPLGELFGESQIIDRIPAVFFAGDPVLGCLVRAGLSASISQIIECTNETAGIEWYRDRIRAIFHCLRENIATMGIRMTGRAIRCVAHLGFG